MNGTIFNFNKQEGVGIIQGDDKKKYKLNFDSAVFIFKEKFEVGMRVRFDILPHDPKTAVNVMKLNNE